MKFTRLRCVSRRPFRARSLAVVEDRLLCKGCGQLLAKASQGRADSLNTDSQAAQAEANHVRTTLVSTGARWYQPVDPDEATRWEELRADLPVRVEPQLSNADQPTAFGIRSPRHIVPDQDFRGCPRRDARRWDHHQRGRDSSSSRAGSSPDHQSSVRS